MNFSLELLPIYCFLIVTLAIGIFYSRGIKTLHDYAIGLKNYSTPILFVSLSATYIGGNTLFGGIEEGFSKGIGTALVVLGGAVASFITGKWIAPKMGRFRGKISLGEILETAYGKQGQITGGVFSFILCTLLVAVQIMAIGYIFEVFLNIPPFWAIILAGGTLVIYSAFGGIEAITVTDVFQFWFLIIVLPFVPFLFKLVLGHLGGFEALFHSLPESHINPFIGKESFFQNLNYFVIFCIPYLYPFIIQRLLMAKDAQQAKSIFYTMGIVQIPLYVLICGIGLVTLALSPELSFTEALAYLINNTLPFWFKQLVILGLLAAIMSTADSILNSGSIALIHDVIRPIVGKKYNLENKELKWTRVATFLIGGFAIIVVLNKFGDLIKTIDTSLLFWVPTIIVPLIGTIIGFKATKQGFLLSVFAGGVTAFVWHLCIYPIIEVDGQLAGVLVNVLIFSISCRSNRSAWELERSTIIKPNRLKAFWKRRVNIVEYLPTPKNIVRFAQERTNLCPPQYFLFGMFIIGNFVFPYFMWIHDLRHPDIAIVLRVMGAFLCVILLIKDFVVQRLRVYIPLYWQLTVLFCLPFSTTYMLFDSQGSSWGFMNTALSLMFGAIILDWLSFILVNFIGVLLGWGFYIFMHGFELITLDPLALYMWLFSLLIGITFSRVRDVTQLRTQVQKLKSLASSIAREMRTPLVSVHLESKSLEKYLPELIKVHQVAQEKGWIQEAQPIPLKIYDYLKKIPCVQERGSRSALTIIDIFLNNTRGISFAENLKPISILSCIENALEEYPFQSKEERELVEWTTKTDFIFKGDTDLKKYILFNLIKNALYYVKAARKGIITIKTQKGVDGNYLYFEDTGEGISSEKLPHIFKHFYTKRNEGTGLGLAFCKDAVESFRGSITCESIKGEYTKFVLRFPKINMPT